MVECISISSFWFVFLCGDLCNSYSEVSKLNLFVAFYVIF